MFELQLHPGDIRKQVRYFFVTRTMLLRAGIGLGLFLVVLTFAIAVSPTVLRDQVASLRYPAKVAQRAALGERLQKAVADLGDLHARSDTARLEMTKIYLAYGFRNDASIGQGGFPFSLEEGALEIEGEPSIYDAEMRRGQQLAVRTLEQMAVLDTFLGEVRDFERGYRDQVHTTPSLSPLRSQDFVLTSPFGNRRSPFTKEIDFHAGIDLAAAVGTPIIAPADGVVTFAGRYPAKRSIGWWRYGNLVALEHGDRFVTLYAHCDTVAVETGQTVSQGDVLATVGNTGWSTSPHLHYEVRRMDDEGQLKPVDPRIYILDHRWRDEEQVLIRARTAPDVANYEPLPRLIRR